MIRLSPGSPRGPVLSRAAGAALTLVLAWAGTACGEGTPPPELPGSPAADTVPAPPEPLPAHPASEAEPDAGPDSLPSGGPSDPAAPAGEGLGASPDPASPAGDADVAGSDVPVAGEVPVFQRPEHVRGLYLTAWTAGSDRRMEQLIELARRTEVNAFVIDIKDASGYVSHRSRVPMAREVGATGELRIGDLPGLLQRLSREGIWPIARIVIVKDPLVAEARPDLAVQDTAGGVWVDGKGIRWLNAYHPEVRAYHLELAREVAAMGFPEIQWDYVRFPDAPRHELERAVFPGAGEVGKSEAIREFLETTRTALREEHDALVTADVFGVTTTARDVGIGQVWEDFIDVVDVALPMVYPSHYWSGSYGIETPNAYPYAVVRRALADARERSRRVEGAGSVRPWLQAFTLGEPPYGPPEIRAQMEAAYDVGIREWILWNPSSRYDEGALEPVGGFESEPRIRIVGRVVPLSEGKELWRLARAGAESAGPTGSSSRGAPDRPTEAGDTTGTPGATGDTVPTPPEPGGSPAADTLPGDSLPATAGSR